MTARHRGFATIFGKALPGDPGADPTEIKLYACFDHVNDFAEALDQQGHCGEVARKVFECCDKCVLPVHAHIQLLSSPLPWPPTY